MVRRVVDGRIVGGCGSRRVALLAWALGSRQRGLRTFSATVVFGFGGLEDRVAREGHIDTRSLRGADLFDLTLGRAGRLSGLRFAGTQTVGDPGRPPH